ncbi:hypothetical protein ANTPLA_LOCUS8245 [Anthophora plagiata]
MFAREIRRYKKREKRNQEDRGISDDLVAQILIVPNTIDPISNGFTCSVNLEDPQDSRCQFSNTEHLEEELTETKILFSAYASLEGSMGRFEHKAPPTVKTGESSHLSGGTPGIVRGDF